MSVHRKAGRAAVEDEAYGKNAKLFPASKGAASPCLATFQKSHVNDWTKAVKNITRTINCASENNMSFLFDAPGTNETDKDYKGRRNRVLKKIDEYVTTATYTEDATTPGTVKRKTDEWQRDVAEDETINGVNDALVGLAMASMPEWVRDLIEDPNTGDSELCLYKVLELWRERGLGPDEEKMVSFYD